MNMSRKTWIVIGIVGVCAGMVRGEEKEKEKEGVALTVYNGGYGVVREIRELDIGADGLVKFKDVASAIDATTVHFKSKQTRPRN